MLKRGDSMIGGKRKGLIFLRRLKIDEYDE